ncbi:MAG: DUF721 domain-containing protein [Paludibacteraceae bacterium]
MRGKTQSLADVLPQYLRESGLEKPVLETEVVEKWQVVMGKTVAHMTRSVEVKDGVLIVHIYSAALRAQLFENRFELVAKLNEAVGAKVLRDVRILS